MISRPGVFPAARREERAKLDMAPQLAAVVNDVAKDGPKHKMIAVRDAQRSASHSAF